MKNGKKVTQSGFHNYIIQILLEKQEDPTVTCKRKNCALQLLLKWNYVCEDDISDYKRTLKLLIGKMQELHGEKIINKIFPNGDTCLHTAGEIYSCIFKTFHYWKIMEKSLYFR